MLQAQKIGSGHATIRLRQLGKSLLKVENRGGSHVFTLAIALISSRIARISWKALMVERADRSAELTAEVSTRSEGLEVKRLHLKPQYFVRNTITAAQWDRR